MSTLLDELGEAELKRVALIAGRLLAGRASSRSGDHRPSSRPGRGLEFLDHRQYLPGDDIRHVDWRQTARRQTPFIKRYQHETTTDWAICLDRSASMCVGAEEKWGMAKRLAGALAYIQLFLGHRVGIVAFSGDVDAFCPLGRGHHQLARVLNLLDSVSPRTGGSGSRPGVCRRHIRANTSVIVLSDFLARGGMRRDLALLKTTSPEVHAIQVLSDADLSIPGEGAFRLTDIESGRDIRVSAGTAAVQAARDSLATLQRDLETFCRRQAIAWSTGGPDRGWREWVLGHLRAS